METVTHREESATFVEHDAVTVTPCYRLDRTDLLTSLLLVLGVRDVIELVSDGWLPILGVKSDFFRSPIRPEWRFNRAYILAEA